MIKAVVFDCFGVLAEDGWLPFREKYFAHDADVLEQAIASNKRVDAGLHSYDDFLSEIAILAGISLAETRAQIETNPPNARLFAYIERDLKPAFKIGMLSNAGANWLSDIFTPTQVALFDEVVLSYQIGSIKPDAVMYETIATRLGLLPEDCLFIDDQQRYVDGAAQVGMTAVLFTDTDTTIARIKELLYA